MKLVSSLLLDESIMAADLTALGYIGICSGKLDDWNTYATGLLGMQRVDRRGPGAGVSHG